MPPQTGKTLLVSKLLPAYILGRDPDKKIISASYSAYLAASFNREAQRFIDSDQFNLVFPKTTLANSKFKDETDHKYLRKGDYFEIINSKGFFRTCGVGGSLTGTPVDIGIIDDPIKDYREARSPRVRENVWQWYSSVFKTRLHNNSQELLTMTRWHSDDLAGRIRALEESEWEILDFEAIKETNNPDDPREMGEALWESRHSKEKMEDARRSNPKIFQALYQQKPVIDGGNLFKENQFRYYKELPEKFDRVIQSWDCAFKGNEESDFVVGTVWGKYKENVYLLDRFRGQWDFNQTIKQFLLMTNKHPDARIKLVEDKANGTALENKLKSEVSGIVTINPQGSKVERAHMCLDLFESGSVYFPDPSIASWVTEYTNELKVFDKGANDDQVDSTTQALNYLFGNDPVARMKRFLS